MGQQGQKFLVHQQGPTRAEIGSLGPMANRNFPQLPRNSRNSTTEHNKAPHSTAQHNTTEHSTFLATRAITLPRLVQCLHCGRPPFFEDAVSRFKKNGCIKHNHFYALRSSEKQCGKIECVWEIEATFRNLCRSSSKRPKASYNHWETFETTVEVGHRKGVAPSPNQRVGGLNR